MAESLLLKLQGKRLEAKTLFYQRVFSAQETASIFRNFFVELRCSPQPFAKSQKCSAARRFQDGCGHHPSLPPCTGEFRTRIATSQLSRLAWPALGFTMFVNKFLTFADVRPQPLTHTPTTRAWTVCSKFRCQVASRWFRPCSATPYAGK